MNPTNLNQYYTGQGQALPSLAARGSIYSSAGLGSGYAGTVAQNNALLAYLQKNGTASSAKSQYIAGQASTPSDTNIGGTSSATPPTPTPSPTGSGSGDGTNGTTDYMANYVKMLSAAYDPTQFATASSNLNALNTQIASVQNSDRDTQASIRANTSGALASGVNGQLGQVSSDDARKLADLGTAASPYQTYVTNALAAAKELGDYQASTTKAKSDAATAAANLNKPFSLGAGQSEYAYDPTTKTYSAVATSPLSAKPQVIGNSSSGYYTVGADGSLSPLLGAAQKKTGSSSASTTNALKSEVNDLLSNGYSSGGSKVYNGRGTDGYVDPGAYTTAYQYWVSNGGTPNTFLSAYPVKTNVNPSSYSLLPAALQPTKKTTTANPFS